MVGVNSRTSCRQLVKQLNILTIASLYILEEICYIRKHHQFVELNSNIHTKEDGHSHPTIKYWLLCKKCNKHGDYITNIKLPGYIKEIDSYITFKKELKSFLLLKTFYSVEEFVAL
jgi:hypothetical protein